MGIHQLNTLLRKKCPHVFQELNIGVFAYEKIAIDISFFIYRLMAGRGDRWLEGFIELVACLRRHDVHCVFCYDGPAPPEKMATHAERKASKDRQANEIDRIKDAICRFVETGVVDDEIQAIYDKAVPSFINKQAVTLEGLEGYLKKKEQQVVHRTDVDCSLTKKLFDILNVPWYDAPTEGETMCAHLNRIGDVKAVLSDDTDVLAYGGTTLISNLNMNTGECIVVEHSDIVEGLELTNESFLDLCIMCGTDYNKNMAGYGPMKALGLMQKHGSIDELANVGFDISILNHERGREIFTKPLDCKYNTPYCGYPSVDELKEYVRENALRISMDLLLRSFARKTMVYAKEEMSIADDAMEQ